MLKAVCFYEMGVDTKLRPLYGEVAIPKLFRLSVDGGSTKRYDILTFTPIVNSRFQSGLKVLLVESVSFHDTKRSQTESSIASNPTDLDREFFLILAEANAN